MVVFFVFRQPTYAKFDLFFIKTLSRVWYTSLTGRVELTLVGFIQYTYHMEQTNQQLGFNEVQLEQLNAVVSTAVNTVFDERINSSLIDYTESVLMPYLDERFKQVDLQIGAAKHELKDYVDRRLSETTSEIFLRLDRRLAPLERRLA